LGVKCLVPGAFLILGSSISGVLRSSGASVAGYQWCFWFWGDFSAFVLVLRGSRFLVPDGLLARACPLVDMAALAGGAGLQFLGVKIAA
jgi:hypothetical protein